MHNNSILINVTNINHNRYYKSLNAKIVQLILMVHRCSIGYLLVFPLYDFISIVYCYLLNNINIYYSPTTREKHFVYK